MKTFYTLLWTYSLLIILCLACRQKNDEPITFAVSEGLMNGMDFSPLGIQTGQRFLPVLLYDLQGRNQTIPSGEKPVLLVTGSYTCDVTRTNLESIEQINREYSDEVEVYLVYTLEAHPESSQSPYQAEPEPWHSVDNIRAGISAPQPRTMEERMQLAQCWVDELQIQTPILLDGARNELWNQAGQAPNMALLLSPEGEVLLKQAWFEKDQMEQALQEELGERAD